MIMGHFHGHIQELGGYLDFNGEQLMQQYARRLHLEVLNLWPGCEGVFTRCAKNSSICIDYVLVSHRLTHRVKHVNIDEEGEFSIGSDHNKIRLTISFSARCKKNSKKAESLRSDFCQKRPMRVLPRSLRTASRPQNLCIMSMWTGM